MQFVVERPRSLHDRDELRDTREPGSVLHVVEAFCEPARPVLRPLLRERQRADPRARCGAPRRSDPLRAALSRGHAAPRPVAGSRRAAAAVAARLDSELVDERAARVLVDAEGLRLAPERYRASIRWARRRSRVGWRSTSASTSPTISAWRPASRSASIRSSTTASRSSFESRDLGLGERLEFEVGSGGRARGRARSRSMCRAFRRLRQRRGPSTTRRRNRSRSTCSGRIASAYPGGFVTRTSAPSAFRSCEMKFCSEVAAVRGGCSAQSASIRRSVETAFGASSRRSARTARCFSPPSRSGPSRRRPRGAQGSESQACEVCNTVPSS